MARKGKTGLTLKERRFVEEYVASDGCLVKAYFRAFGRKTTKGVIRSYLAASKSASRLVKNPLIEAEIQAIQEDYARNLRISKRKVIREIAAIAFFDPADVYDEDPDTHMPVPKPWNEVPPVARKAIQKVKVKRRRLRDKDNATEWEIEEFEYKFHSKSPELDKICKKLGFYTEQQQPAGDTDERAVIELPSNGRDSE